MKKQQRRLAKVLAIAMLAVALGVFLLFWGGFLSPGTQAQPFTPHYLSYQGAESRIYAVSETASYSIANQTYTATDGTTVPEGSELLTISITLRNDYSSENPPPNMGTPVSPIDGTAYIRLQPVLYDNNNYPIQTVNLSHGDFPSVTADQTGLVLSSGQTSQVQLVIAAAQNAVRSFTVSLSSISDSI